ncbi:cation:proton antiporter [Actinoplanes teichomyceticus]|uniref:Potassium/proton antiporter membrane subunit (CPA2 family) n=1 Tax=Actinoplanes teichomyceticus TaxID=1867 RepID=A0A561WK90_ACTTI|nr:cation:proton antiporter [Actinoplanes teichomyceticus]TWG24268.1 potassium/proton antiporter membrane subunit (CPA2 family) [Actinoplanes teichomyceticus]GIF12886.1 potassium transporter [Actinoplanes teichomyceticus]
MHTSVALLVELGVVLAALSFLGAAARRFGFSPIPLYLLAGLALGPGGVAPVPAAGEFIRTGATIGVVLLLLTLGLEFSVEELSVSLRRHLPSAGVDMVLNAVPGALTGRLLGLDWTGSLALAGITWISSSGIIARLLTDLRRLGNRETPAVLSVLVLEDVATAGFLPLLAVLASGGAWWQAVLGMSLGVAVVVLAFIASRRLRGPLARLLDTADTEQMLLRVLSLTLIVAGVTELLEASAAVGAFLLGLALTGQVADRTRAVIGPLRDLFAAAFFLAVGLSVHPADLVPMLPAALALAAVTGCTKIATGWYAAGRDGAGPQGRLRAGTALITRGEFSLVIASLIGTAGHGSLGPLTAAYVIVLAVAGPVATRLIDRPAAGAATAARARPEQAGGGRG